VKKTILQIVIFWMFSISVNAQTDDAYAPSVVEGIQNYFNKYDAVIEATVISTEIKKINGRYLNKVNLNIHRDYKGSFTSGQIIVYMLLDDKLKSELNGKTVQNTFPRVKQARASHLQRPAMNPVTGISGHFFLRNYEYLEKKRWLISEWDAYPNKKHYELIQEYKGADQWTDVYYFNNLYHLYGVFISTLRWDSLENLYSYLHSVGLIPINIYVPVSIDYFAPPARFEPAFEHKAKSTK
jgi:hypothetical protein